jgi:hypothetical protein
MSRWRPGCICTAGGPARPHGRVASQPPACCFESGYQGCAYPPPRNRRTAARPQPGPMQASVLAPFATTTACSSRSWAPRPSSFKRRRPKKLCRSRTTLIYFVRRTNQLPGMPGCSRQRPPYDSARRINPCSIPSVAMTLSCGKAAAYCLPNSHNRCGIAGAAAQSHGAATTTGPVCARWSG